MVLVHMCIGSLVHLYMCVYCELLQCMCACLLAVLVCQILAFLSDVVKVRKESDRFQPSIIQHCESRSPFVAKTSEAV